MHNLEIDTPKSQNLEIDVDKSHRAYDDSHVLV